MFVDHRKKEVVFAIRGTDPRNIADLGTDLFLIANKLKLTPRYHSEKRALKKTLRKYPKGTYSYLLTGHSLAGALSIALSKAFDLPAKVYNPGMGLGSVRSGLRDRAACRLRPNGERCRDVSRIEIQRTGKDVISVLGTGPNVKIVPQREGLGAHDIANFTDE